MIKIKKYPSKEYINSIFEYKNNALYYKKRNSNIVRKDLRAGHKNDRGYITIRMNKKHFRSHRLIWIMHYGDIPKGLFIDHINHITDDNRLENLRLVTNQENQWNSVRKGYHKCKRSGKYMSYIHLNDKSIFLGYYNTKEEARQKYLEKKKKIHIIKER